MSELDLPHLRKIAEDQKAINQRAQLEREEEDRAADEAKRKRIADREFLLNSQAIEIIKSGARLLQDAGLDTSLKITSAIETEKSDPLVILAWGIHQTGIQHGLGSDSYDEELYSWSQITCRTDNNGEVVIAGLGTDRAEDSDLASLTEVIDRAFQKPEFISNKSRYNSTLDPISFREPTQK